MNRSLILKCNSTLYSHSLFSGCIRLFTIDNWQVLWITYARILNDLACAMGFELVFYSHLPLVMHFRGHTWDSGIFSSFMTSSYSHTGILTLQWHVARPWSWSILLEYTRPVFLWAGFPFVLRLRSSPTKGTALRSNNDLEMTANMIRHVLTILVGRMLSALYSVSALSREFHPLFDSFASLNA